MELSKWIYLLDGNHEHMSFECLGEVKFRGGGGEEGGLYYTAFRPLNLTPKPGTRLYTSKQ